MVRRPTNLIMISLLVTISTVVGCGVMPAGQASNRTFTVTGFTTLPIAMVYTSVTNAARFSGIATSKEGAKGFVQRLVMQTIIDVLERQGRSALLPDAVISAILSQLTVVTSYTPMNCPMVTSPEENHGRAVGMAKTYCIVAGNTVTGICTIEMDQMGMCNMPMNNMVTVTAISGVHLTISGTLSTTNIIMANWSRTMWQSVVDRAVRMLVSGPFGSHFFSARATVDGN
ncbi:hypothetical protein KIN20_006148 [Parelaphostrongylus tenuis]|uniref:Uncharacterized protein n=1 Tax=Parelaphostrongylus tenuis TaxID=148309 RepID=A0AAD5MM55_PARTN|nr:hypothetical protein KIN20_006148 [Parelaphostrongylus tenuis]